MISNELSHDNPIHANIYARFFAENSAKEYANALLNQTTLADRFESLFQQASGIKAKPRPVEAAQPLVEMPLSDTATSQVKSQQPPVDSGWIGKLKNGLTRTRGTFSTGLKDLFSTSQSFDQQFFDQLETQLIMADVGVKATSRLIADLKQFAQTHKLDQTPNSRQRLQHELQQQLLACLKPRTPAGNAAFLNSAQAAQSKTKMVLVVGVNGVGKTTTIGKLAQQCSTAGQSVILAAGDTFRAAAVEQLKIWGDRINVPVIAQEQGSDSASVIFDAFQSAKSKGADLLIADTAGRLHNKSNLMTELQKIVKVLKKIDPTAPHEVLLVLDGCTGQNAISQAKEFIAAVDCTGVVITKLDGTAKGGIVFALGEAFGLPVRYIGIGEGVDDLKAFSAEDFVEALFDIE